MSLARIQSKLPAKLYPFIHKRCRYKVAYGGRGGAKSQSIADIFLFLCAKYGYRLGCFREFQNSIDDSVLSLLVDEIDKLKIPGFTVANNSIYHTSGGNIKFKGLARNIGSVKSMHGFNIVWVEEAQNTSSESLRILIPSVRETGSELWFSFNAMASADPISKKFIKPYIIDLDDTGVYEDEDHYICKINYKDNPFFPEVLDKDRILDYKTLPRALYDHIWLGAYNDSVENSIIQPQWFDAAIDAHKRLGFEPLGQKVMSHDPSDMGGDTKGFVGRHGNVITHAELLPKSEVNVGADEAIDRAKMYNADLFIWDGGGVGAGLRKQVKQAFDHTKIGYHMFNGSNSVDKPGELYQEPGKYRTKKDDGKTNKETFRNRRAQRYWGLRDRLITTYNAVCHRKFVDPDKYISISSKIKHMDAFRSELCRIPRKPTGSGLIQIMSKEDMRKPPLNIESPGLADSAMMMYDAEVYNKKKHKKKTFYRTLWS